MKNKEIKVSVCLVTYNQEQYIEQCLQSLVDQKTDFKFEIIVSDDCSTDKTSEIIKIFQNKYPDIIKPILHKKNMGALKNFVFVHNQATGEYIAHMDGDDYALPEKLQRQADFLDENPECNILWTPILIELFDGRLIEQSLRFRNKALTRSYNKAELIRFGTIGANSTKMYRKSVREIIIPNFEVMDYFLNIEQVGNGVACFVGTEPLGVYRAGVGIASASLQTRNVMVDSLKYLLGKYPEHRLDISLMAMALFLSDIKNKRSTRIRFLKILLSTVSFSTVFLFVKDYSFRKSLNVTGK